MYFVIWVSWAGVRCDEPARDTIALDAYFERMYEWLTEMDRLWPK